jgi:hypothetical protein
MKVQYWPNEPVMQSGTVKPEGVLPTFTQAGGRVAFKEMADTRFISALDVYPYRERFERLKTEFLQDALQAIETFKPDILFVQHVTGCPLPSDLWRTIRQKYPSITIVYHDADPYAPLSKRIDVNMVLALQSCHLSLVCGLGYPYQAFRKISNAPVRYVPHCFEYGQFHSRDVRLEPKAYDLIMIGNRGTRRRARFLYHPGGRDRARLAEAASREFGRAFALYGSGWDGLAANRGRLEFFDQERAIQAARISINWDHFDEIPYYFSDRLPISLAAGVPHVTSYHQGYEHIFRGCDGLYACKTWQEVLECTRWLLSKSEEELADLGLKAQAWVENNLAAPAVFRQALALSIRAHQERGIGAQ